MDESVKEVRTKHYQSGCTGTGKNYRLLSVNPINECLREPKLGFFS